jgi:hypothetical protein
LHRCRRTCDILGAVRIDHHRAVSRLGVNGARIVQRLSVEKCSARRGELVPSLLGLLLNERVEAHPPPEEDGVAAIVTTSQMATILPRPLRDADAGRP